MRWWWFGSAVTKPELEREMRMMKAGGIGGFEVQPVYPLALDDPSKLQRALALVDAPEAEPKTTKVAAPAKKADARRTR